jgi:hypothetical protein
LSNALCSGVGLGLGVPAAAGEVAVVLVVVAGDIAAVEGVIPGAGERPATVAEAPGAVVVVVVVAGLIAVAGLVAGAVVVLAGAVAGLIAGGAPGGLFGGGWLAGEGWPKELKAMVTEKRLAISVVFIELIGKLFRPLIPLELGILIKEISASRAKLSRMGFFSEEPLN